MAALSSRVKGLKVRAPQGLTRRSRASPVSPCPGLLLGRHRRLPRFATAHASAPPRVTPTTQFMQRAQERETLAKAKDKVYKLENLPLFLEIEADESKWFKNDR